MVVGWRPTLSAVRRSELARSRARALAQKSPFNTNPAFIMPGMKTILDVDIGVDDCLALLLAFASPELDIAAVTPSFGNTSAAHVSSNLNKLFYLLQQELESDSYRPGSYPVLEGIREGKRLKIVVPKSGASQPIEGELEMAEYFVRLLSGGLRAGISQLTVIL